MVTSKPAAQPQWEQTMSPVKPNFDPENFYFITTTAVNRAHLFLPDRHKQIIAESLDYMRLKNWLNLFAFVLMPNHIHLLVHFLTTYKLPNVMREFKKHTSKQIILACKNANNQELLSYMEEAARTIRGQKYIVWEDGYDAREVFSLPFLQQKMDYLHNNPCQPQWRLVDQPEDYLWSSACFYLLGKPSVISIDDVREYLIP